MPTLFVKYTPDIEAADPGFDENLQTVIAKTERYIARSVTTEGTGRAVRDAHAKGYGLVRGEVEILDQLPAEYAQGIYATARKARRARSASPTARRTPEPTRGSVVLPDWR